MIRSEAIVDYEKCRKADVVFFIDNSDAATTYRIISEHGSTIERLAALFAARVILADQARVSSEAIVENDLADAWITIVAEGPSRALSTKKNPNRLNVDNRNEWEFAAFKEIVRQIKESTKIIEDVTGYYGTFTFGTQQNRGAQIGLRTN